MTTSDYVFLTAWVGIPIVIGLLADHCFVIIWDTLLDMLKAYARR